jgi:hypothetical protein
MQTWDFIDGFAAALCPDLTADRAPVLADAAGSASALAVARATATAVERHINLIRYLHLTISLRLCSIPRKHLGV